MPGLFVRSKSFTITVTKDLILKLKVLGLPPYVCLRLEFKSVIKIISTIKMTNHEIEF